MSNNDNHSTDSANTSVFLLRSYNSILYGGDEKTLSKVMDVLKHLGISVLEWDDVSFKLKVTVPDPLDVVRRAFDEASAVVALLTPEEKVYTSDHLREAYDDDFVDKETPNSQASSDVLFMTGMALALHQDRTVIVVAAEHDSIIHNEASTVRTSDKNWAEQFAKRLKTALENSGKSLDLTEPMIAKLKKI